jgi:hypothetical protein
VLADAIPDDITAKATMNVKKGVRKARWLYSAAPAARGYFETSSAYANAVNSASTKAAMNDVQMAPPTSAPTSPTSA